MGIERRIMIIGATVIGINVVLSDGLGYGGDIKANLLTNPSHSIYLPILKNQEPSEVVERVKTFHDILGVHDTPNINGSIFPSLAISDAKRLGAKSMVIINPRERILEKAAESGITIIARWYSHDNKFDGDELGDLIERLKNYQETPIIVVGNEVNLLHETNGVYRSPEEHIEEDFLPSLNLISGMGGITLLTPLSQEAVTYEDGRPIDEFEYFSRMLLTLSKYLTVEELQQYVALGVHAYAMYPGEDLRPRLFAIDNATREILGVRLPIYITEGGLYQNRKMGYAPKIVAAETRRLIEAQIGTALDIRSFNLWVLANDVYRLASDAQDPDLMEDFEAAALRKSTEVTPTYEMLEVLARK